MTDLFAATDGQTAPLTAPIEGAAVPLAERMRPAQLETVVGQEHLTMPGGPLFQMVRSRKPKSMIFWGPPGTGKTTIAQLIAELFDFRFVQLSAIHSGVADLKKVFEGARAALRGGGRPTVLFVDEIHRFNKAQQDAFLPDVESGTIVLVGATTENPSFEINGALLSRAQVYILKPLDHDALSLILERAEQTHGMLPVTEEARRSLIENSGGDARFMLGQAEILMTATPDKPLGVEAMGALLNRRMASHDKAGDGHYDLASAFQKSIRGSNPQAALYYGARMFKAGDVAMVVRRLMVTASEEVGMADPTALLAVVAAAEAHHRLGDKEGGYAIGQAIIHVSTAPKSNAAYKAWGLALAFAEQTANVKPPKRIMNAPTKLMKQQGYKEGYQYDHDAEGAFSGQDFWPDELEPQRFYEPSPRGIEPRIRERLDHWDAIREERRADRSR
jgi:putative ATPase